MSTDKAMVRALHRSTTRSEWNTGRRIWLPIKNEMNTNHEHLRKKPIDTTRQHDDATPKTKATHGPKAGITEVAELFRNQRRKVGPLASWQPAKLYRGEKSVQTRAEPGE